MTEGIVGAIAGGAIAVIGTLVVSGIFLVRYSLRASDKLGDSRVALVEERSINSNWQRETESLREQLADLESQLSREVTARMAVERQRDELLDELANSGEPSAVADSIRDELRRVSEDVPEVPDP